jgi:Flp pilus assembly protein TadG
MQLKENLKFNLSRAFEDQRGQVLVWLALSMVALLGMVSLSVDLGHAYYVHCVLQSSSSAAALAGARNLPNSAATTIATNYSSVAGAVNFHSNLPTVTMVAGYPQVTCLSTLTGQGIPCLAPANANAIVVSQQANVPMFFAKILGYGSLTVSATATASARRAPYNVAVILDATLSQNATDDNCGATEMVCELDGVQHLLMELDPCSTTLVTCTITNGVSQSSFDRAALFTFPDVSVGTVGIDSSCTTPIPSSYSYSPLYGNYSMPPVTPWSGVPTAEPYSFPSVGASSYSPGASPSTTPTYQVTPFLSDYRTSDTATSLNPQSALVMATGGVSGCGGMMPPNYDGSYGTYYAGVLYAAQAALVAEQTANPGSQNVIIILSDGNATAPQVHNYNNITTTVMPPPATSNGTYPSWTNECAQAVTAAQYAASQGTTVYSVAYGSETSGCSADSSGITPCQTMTQMASSSQYFYSDYLQSGAGIDTTCISASNPNDTSIAQIFAHINSGFKHARLIPNGLP